MGEIKVTKCSKEGKIIEGLYIIEPMVHGDSRGYFIETYNKEDLIKHGIDAEFVQDNESKSRHGVLRGLHFQIEHPQGKLVRAQKGRIYDVAVDLRKNSQTFGMWYGVELSEDNHLQFFIPEGFAHGFYVMSDEAVFCYKCTDFYHPEDEDGIKWDDETLAIDWPTMGEEPVLSEKDKKRNSFKEYFNLH